MSDLDPRSDEAYRRAAEMADAFAAAIEESSDDVRWRAEHVRNALARAFPPKPHRVRDWLRLTWARLEIWLGIR